MSDESHEPLLGIRVRPARQTQAEADAALFARVLDAFLRLHPGVMPMDDWSLHVGGVDIGKQLRACWKARNREGAG